MHIAVAKGAAAGQSFVQYVDFLESGHFTPPDSKLWIDHVRKQGNRAAHEISQVSVADASELIDFVELILRFLYEFPGRMNAKLNP